MKATTALKNLEKVANNEKSIRNWKLTAAWKLINRVIMCQRNSIRPCYYSGSGRFTSKLDYTADVQYLLGKAGIRYTLTNDAPRGSETGNLITMTHIEY